MTVERIELALSASLCRWWSTVVWDDRVHHIERIVCVSGVERKTTIPTCAQGKLYCLSSHDGRGWGWSKCDSTRNSGSISGRAHRFLPASVQFQINFWRMVWLYVSHVKYRDRVNSLECGIDLHHWDWLIIPACSTSESDPLWQSSLLTHLCCWTKTTSMHGKWGKPSTEKSCSDIVTAGQLWDCFCRHFVHKCQHGDFWNISNIKHEW